LFGLVINKKLVFNNQISSCFIIFFILKAETNKTMEYSFISRQSFDNLVKQYIDNLAPNKKEKALINQEKLQKIKEVLLNPTDTTLYTSTFRYWVKNKFKLQKISSDSYIVLYVQTQNKKNNEKIIVELPVLVTENMYDEFCKIHSMVT